MQKHIENVTKTVSGYRSFIMAVSISTTALTAPQALAGKYASVVIDAESGKVLEAVNADARRYPASLTKIMTLYMVFDALEQKKITLNTRMRVSKRAQGATPSKLGLRAGQTIRVEDAILALVTKSANDVATVVAEHIGGTEVAFADLMNEKAKAIGMKRTTFRNASGLPNRRQLSTARDMAILGMRIRHDFPDMYSYFGNKSFTYKGRKYTNHNKLLHKMPGTDGIKTGYIRDSGFNLVASTVQDGHRLIGVVFGGRTGKTRDAHMVKLLSRGFAKVDALYVRAPDRELAMAAMEKRRMAAKSREELALTVAKAQEIESMVEGGYAQVSVMSVTANAKVENVSQVMKKVGIKSLKSPLLVQSKGMVRLVPLDDNAKLEDLNNLVALSDDIGLENNPQTNSVKVATVAPEIFSESKRWDTLPVKDNPTAEEVAAVTPNFTKRATPTVVPLGVMKSVKDHVDLSRILAKSMKPKAEDVIKLVSADAYITQDSTVDTGHDERFLKLAEALTDLRNQEAAAKPQANSQAKPKKTVDEKYKRPPKKESRKYSVGPIQEKSDSKSLPEKSKHSSDRKPLDNAPGKARLQLGAYGSLEKAKKAAEIARQSLGVLADMIEIEIDPVSKKEIYRLRLNKVPAKEVPNICTNVYEKGLGCLRLEDSKI